jgi:hypothetical protein
VTVPRRGGRAKGPFPAMWKSGPDPVRHQQHIAWHKARAQAHFRGEIWNLTFEQWVELWGDRWDLRGRQRGCLCIGRRDPTLPWDTTNTQLVTREEHNRKNWRKL